MCNPNKAEFREGSFIFGGREGGLSRRTNQFNVTQLSNNLFKVV